jgi:hypothetical protein
MNINTAILLSCFFHELNGVIENTFYAFAYMIFKMVIFINYSFILEVRFTIISSTVYNMSDTSFLESFFIFRDLVASKK